MGFRPPANNLQIMWGEDHRLHGLVVEAKGLRLGAMLDLAKMYLDSGIAGKEDESDMSVEDLELMLAMFRILVGNDDTNPPNGPDGGYRPGLILRWNRDGDDGNPLPISMEGVRELELWEFQEIMSAYLEHGGAKLEDPLSGDSKSGKPSQELDALTALESLSQES